MNARRLATRRGLTVFWVGLLAGLLGAGTGMARGQTPPGGAASGSEARDWIAKILSARPETGFTNRGVLKHHDPAAGNTSVALTCTTIPGSGQWRVIYQAGDTVLTVVHADGGGNRYTLRQGKETARDVSGAGTAEAFAGSDFAIGDLGLEFLHWPGQKLVRKEFHRNCSCVVLESSQTQPAPGAATVGYARVVAWFDEESLGVVEAEAYDAAGNEIRNFYPKDLQKVNGAYQVGTLVMKNPQTGSRTVMEFNLDGPDASPEK